MAVLRARENRGLKWGGKNLPKVRLDLSALCFWGSPHLSAQTAPLREYQIKAVFLFNFAEFVTWPPEAFPDPQAPLVIGVLGEDPFCPLFEEVVRGERVNDRQLVVERYRRVEDIKVCHILFVSRSEADRLGEIMSRLKNRSV